MSGLSSAFAQVTWDGSVGTGSWGTTGNWDTGSLPGSGDDVIFDAANANSQFSIDLGSTRTVRGITFDATGSSGFTFNSGNQLRVAAGGLTNNNSNTQTFDADYRINSDQTWNAAAGDFVFNDVDQARSVTITGSNDVTLNGTLTALGNRNFTNNGTGTVTVNNVDLTTNTSRRLTFTGTGNTTISGLISNAGDLRKQGTGTLTITGPNTYTGESVLSGGTVAIGDNAAFGTGRVDLGNFTLDSTGGARNVANDTRLTGTFRFGGTDDIELSGTMTLINNRNIYADGTGTYLISGDIELSDNTSNRRLTVRGANDVEISGDISNGASATAGLLTKNDAGTLTLSGTNTYDGVTDMNAGTLIINGDNSGLSGQFRLDNGDVEVGAANAFGTGELRLANGDIRGDGTARTISNSQVTLAGNGTIIEGSSDIEFTGTMTVTGGTRTMTVNNTANTTFGDIALSEGSSNRQLNLNGTGNTTLGGNITNGGTATASRLTINNTGTTTIDGTMSHGGVTDINNGTVIINSANTTTGNFQLDGGITQVGNNDAFGSSLVRITNGTLQGDGTARTIANNIQIAANGGEIAGSSDLTHTGTVTLTNNRTLEITNTGETTLGDVTLGSRTFTLNVATTAIIDGVASGSGRITKTGAGTLTLAGNNTYTGATTVSAGTLQIGNGGTSGSIVGNLVNNSAVVWDRSDASTYSGNISGNGTLDHAGSGNTTLSGNNTYTGATTVSAGTLTLASNNALGNTSSGTTVDAAGTLALTNNISVGEAITNNGTVTNTSDTNTLSGVISGTGAVTTTGGNLTLSNTNTYSGNTTVGSGSTVTLSADDALGTGSTTVNSGGTLALTGGITAAQTGYTLAGTGNGGVGAIQNVSGDNRLTGDFTLSADTTIQATAGTLNVGTFWDIAGFVTATDTFDTAGNTLTFDGAGNTVLAAELDGSGNVIKNGTGTLTFENSRNRDWTGTTTINDGELISRNLFNNGTPGAPGTANYTFNNTVTIGDGIGAAGSATLTIGTNDRGAGFNHKNAFADGVDLVINSDGRFNTRGHEQYVQDVTLDGGTIDAWTNANAVVESLFITGSITATESSTINGKIDLNGDAAKVIDVQDSGETLDITALIDNGGFDKQGDGILELSGVNTYTGNVDISEGIVLLESNTGLGATAGSTNVDSGAQLQLSGVTVGAEALTLNGSGISSDGALQTVASSGANSWAGSVTLASATEIEVSSGSSLTISGNITGSGQTLTVDGPGNSTFTGTDTFNTLNKTGSGTLTLSSNTKTVSTINVSGGTLDLGTSDIIANTADLNISGTGTFTMGGSINETIDQFTQSNGTLDVDGVLTLNGGTISGGDGSGSSGTMVLTAGNTLNITNDYDFGGTLELTAGTTLALSGASTIDIGTLNITGNTVIDFGADANTLNLGALTIAGGVSVTVNNWISFQDLWTTGSFQGGSGSVTIDERDSNTAQITFSGFSPSDTIWLTFDFGANEITVPEPGTYGATLMAFGLAMWTLRRRPRKVKVQ